MNFKDGDWRMSVHCITSGQPRAYADSVYTYQVYFEWVPYDTRVQEKKFIPVSWNEDLIKAKLQSVKRFYEKENLPDPFAPELVYLKKLDEGLWEFSVRERFTD